MKFIALRPQKPSLRKSFSCTDIFFIHSGKLRQQKKESLLPGINLTKLKNYLHLFILSLPAFQEGTSEKNCPGSKQKNLMEWEKEGSSTRSWIIGKRQTANEKTPCSKSLLFFGAPCQTVFMFLWLPCCPFQSSFDIKHNQYRAQVDHTVLVLIKKGLF